MTEEILKSIEEKLERLSGSDRTSKWKKADVVLGALTPLAVVAVGVIVDWRIEERAQTNAAIEDRLNRMALIPSFMEALTGEDRKRQLLAVRTINDILPEDGPRLLAGIAADVDAEGSPELREALNEGMRSRIVTLVKQMFGDNRETRVAAYNELRTGFDATLVAEEVVARGLSDLENSNGVINAVLLLNQFSRNELLPVVDQVREFAEKAAENGPKTRQQVEKLLEKIEP